MVPVPSPAALLPPAPPSGPPPRDRRRRGAVLAAVLAAGIAVASQALVAAPGPGRLQPALLQPTRPADDPPGSQVRAPSAPPDRDRAPVPRPPAPGAPRPAAPSGSGGPPAITVEGNRILRGGEPWWFLGYNSFVWSGDCGDPDERMSTDQVEEWFAGMRDDGHGAVRLFFYEGWDLDRLDHALAAAQRHGIYLTITLDDAIGGCGENDKTAAWFADRAERDAFRTHMETLLERYRGETAIAWFEYFNEPDHEDGALREFYDEMGAVADRIDPDRLFSSGTVAPYWVDGEDNFLDIHRSPGVDVASLHEYDQDEVESNHGDDVRANSAGKPVIVGEFGIEACEGDFASRAERVAAKAEAYTGTDGYAGAFVWAWQPGGGGCELGNVDADAATQEVLREAGAGRR